MIYGTTELYFRSKQLVTGSGSLGWSDGTDGLRSRLVGKLRSFMGQGIRFYLSGSARLSGGTKGVTTTKRERKVIVSLTSFPPRIETLWLCIETLLRQRTRPDELILWLARSQFPGGLDDLPPRLLAQRERGLSIRFCEDLKSHKKYYYALQEFDDHLVITVDDDVFYPENTVEELMRLHDAFPGCICCNRAHRIAFDDEDTIAEYSRWEKGIDDDERPSSLLCPTGIGGVLYPPGSLDEEVLNAEAFMKLCRYGDDIWLKVMSLRRGTKVVSSSVLRSTSFLSIPGSDKGQLSTLNVGENVNDEQLGDILEYYGMTPLKHAS